MNLGGLMQDSHWLYLCVWGDGGQGGGILWKRNGYNSLQ